MNPVLLIALAVALLPEDLLAQTLPYDADTGTLRGEWLILSADETQILELSNRRSFTLTGAQKVFLSLLFPRVPDTLNVVSGAFNGFGRDLPDTHIHAVWLRDRSLGITYSGDFAAADPKTFREHASFVCLADPDRLIISHDAKVFRQGRELSLDDVFALIDKLATDASAKPAAKGPLAHLPVSLPPRMIYHPTGEDWMTLFHAFHVYGELKSVSVYRSW
jgi:hypothetical protein